MSVSVAAAAVDALHLQDLDYWTAAQVFDFMTWADGFDFTQVLRDDITPNPQNVLEMWCHLRYGDPSPDVLGEWDGNGSPSPLELRRRDWNRVRQAASVIVYDRDHGACQMCGVALHASNRTIDHIVPISLGGTDELSNLRAACRSCNSRKGNRP